MDSLTHVFFAYKLLESSGQDTAAAICSLFPQIDRKPAYLHRMYAHPFFKIRKLAECGADVYKNGRIRAGCEDRYEWIRFMEERSRIISFGKEFGNVSGLCLPEFDPDIRSVLIAYVSHTYQDIFNNPMQAFLPHSVYPCGKWKLWTELDPDFRIVLYQPSVIGDFRSEFFNDNIWRTRLDPTALIYAMIDRTESASVAKLRGEMVENAFESLGLNLDSGGSETKLAEGFLIEHEALLETLIKKYSSMAKSGVGRIVFVKS